MNHPHESDADRERWDADDRVRCTCVHRDWYHPANGLRQRSQCLNSTRHPSGHCGDCRTVEDIEQGRKEPS